MRKRLSFVLPSTGLTTRLCSRPSVLMLAASPSMVLRSIFRRGFAADASSADNETDCMVIDSLLLELSAGRDLRVPSTLTSFGKTGAPAPGCPSARAGAKRNGKSTAGAQAEGAEPRETGYFS